MLAYAGVEYPRTLSLMVWRRSNTIIMMLLNLIHTLIMLEAAITLHTVTLASWKERSPPTVPLTKIMVNDTHFWSTDPVLNAELVSHDFSKPKGFKPRFFSAAGQCLDANVSCPPHAIECVASSSLRLLLLWRLLLLLLVMLVVLVVLVLLVCCCSSHLAAWPERAAAAVAPQGPGGRS